MSSRNVVFTAIASLLLGACATDGPGDGSIFEHLFARNGGEAPVQDTTRRDAVRTGPSRSGTRPEVAERPGA